MRIIYILFGSVVLWMQHFKELEADIQERNTALVRREFPLLPHALKVYREDSIFVRLFKL